MYGRGMTAAAVLDDVPTTPRHRQTRQGMATQRTSSKKREAIRQAYLMSCETVGEGANQRQRYTWDEIADRHGFPSRHAAQMAVTRYRRALGDVPDQDTYGPLAPWVVPVSQQVEYCYKMWLLTQRRAHGRPLTGGELTQLLTFEAMLGPLPDAPYGCVVLFDEDDEQWKIRRRREDEPQDQMFVRE